jgi:hypothetical protein
MRLTRSLCRLFAAILVLAGCASPQEKAMKRALNDYRRASADSARYAREQVAKLATAAQAFHAANKRWPYKLDELAGFAFDHKLDFDEIAFNEVSFAALADGSLQARYDVNCARFHTQKHRFVQQGTVNIKPR